MKLIKPRFFQFDCLEKNRVDLREAKAILRYRPDIIIFEMPEINGKPDLIFNKYDCKNKPFKKLEEIQANLRKNAKQFKYALSDVEVWKNIEYLWRENHDILLYNVDAPREVRQEFFELRHTYPLVPKKWVWGVKLYIRECIMANHIQNILKRYTRKSNPIILIFLQKYHWGHVKLLLKNPSKKEIWKFYFGKFSEVTNKNIASEIKKQSNILYKYWLKLASPAVSATGIL